MKKSGLIVFIIILCAMAILSVYGFVSGDSESAFAFFFIFLLLGGILVFAFARNKWIARLPEFTTKATIIAKNIVVEKISGAEPSQDREETHYKISFKTENNIEWTFDFSLALYNAFMEGDYGTLVYKESKGGKVYYQNFLREKQNAKIADEATNEPILEKPQGIKCSNCGASVKFDRDKNTGVCEFCQTEIFVPKSKEETEYENKFVLAQNMEKVYFMSGHNAVHKNGKIGFDAVREFYGEAELAGGGTKEEYWIAIARFYVKGALFGFQNGSVKLHNRQQFIGSYVLFMDNAIRCSQNEKTVLEEEKQKTVEWLNVELQKYREKNKSFFG